MNTIKFAPYNAFVTEQHDVKRGYMKRLEMNGEQLKVYQPCNLDVFVVNRCHNRCFFCIHRHYTGDIIGSDFLVGLEDAVTRLQQAGIDLEVTITGGEPTIRPNRFVDVIKLLHRLGVRERTVSTTGLNLLAYHDGKPLIQHLIDCGYTHNISISRMSTNYAAHEIMMGNTDDWMPDIDNAQLHRLARYCNTYGVELRTSTNLIRKFKQAEGVNDLKSILDFVAYHKSIGIKSCLFRELVGNYPSCKVEIKPIQEQIHTDPRFEFVKDIDGQFYEIKLYVYTDPDGTQYAVKCYQDAVPAQVGYSRLSYKSGILRAGFDGPILYEFNKEHPSHE